MKITLFSFGFKYGIPEDANMIWDVRFLPNPYWVKELRPMTGLVKEVSDYVVESSKGIEFIKLVKPLLLFLVESNMSVSKEEMTLAIGCTGGMHRSVAMVEKLKKTFADPSIELNVYHRDIDREGE